MEQPTQMEQPTEVQVMNDRELEQLVQGFSQSPSLPPPATPETTQDDNAILDYLSQLWQSTQKQAPVKTQTLKQPLPDSVDARFNKAIMPVVHSLMWFIGAFIILGVVMKIFFGSSRR